VRCEFNPDINSLEGAQFVGVLILPSLEGLRLPHLLHFENLLGDPFFNLGSLHLFLQNTHALVQFAVEDPVVLASFAQAH